MNIRERVVIWERAKKITWIAILLSLASFGCFASASEFMYQTDSWRSSHIHELTEEQIEVSLPFDAPKVNTKDVDIYRLKQGWNDLERWVYWYVSQGSQIIPMSWFLNLKIDSASMKRFGLDANTKLRSDTYLKKMRFVTSRRVDIAFPDKDNKVQTVSFNEHNLPIGFVTDKTSTNRLIDGKGDPILVTQEMVGVNCSACHVSVIKGATEKFLVDGSPSHADFDYLVISIVKSLEETINNMEKMGNLLKNVYSYESSRGATDSADDLAWRQKTYSQIVANTLALRARINMNRVPENLTNGFGRLDAFGNIFNEATSMSLIPSLNSNAQEKFVDSKNLAETGIADAEAMKAHYAKWNWGINDPVSETETNDFLDELNRTVEVRFPENVEVVNAPVSYPVIWDAYWQPTVQWTGTANNDGIGSIVRNAGEVVGVFGDLRVDIVDGKAQLSHHINFDNIIFIEELLKRLDSPVWPDQNNPAYSPGYGKAAKTVAVFPVIDTELKAVGRKLFVKNCQHCHSDAPTPPGGGKDTADNEYRKTMSISMVSLKKIKTDAALSNKVFGETSIPGVLAGSSPVHFKPDFNAADKNFQKANLPTGLLRLLFQGKLTDKKTEKIMKVLAEKAAFENGNFIAGTPYPTPILLGYALLYMISSEKPNFYNTFGTDYLVASGYIKKRPKIDSHGIVKRQRTKKRALLVKRELLGGVMALLRDIKDSKEHLAKKVLKLGSEVVLARLRRDAAFLKKVIRPDAYSTAVNEFKTISAEFKQVESEVAVAIKLLALKVKIVAMATQELTKGAKANGQKVKALVAELIKAQPEDFYQPMERSYKARPLNGIWSSAPYLHNGSVPNLDVLLMTQAERNKQLDSIAEVKTSGGTKPPYPGFYAGSERFDTAKLGFLSSASELSTSPVESGKDRFTMINTTVPGNQNIGHIIKGFKQGKLKPFTPGERKSLIEYLKSI